jgi:hypothetical protein
MNQNYFAVKWYEDQQQKKKDNYERGQVSLLNRNLQNILHQIEDKISKEYYEAQEKNINRKLVSSHLWNIGFLNNLENKEIALEQGVFLTLILHLEDSISNRAYLQQEVERYMRQLGDIDWGMYGEFNRRKHSILRIKDKTTELKRYL